MCTSPIFQHGFWRWTEPGITNWTSEHHSFGYVVALMLWHSVGLAVGNIVASGLLQQVWHFLWRQMESWRGLPDYPNTDHIQETGVDSFLISFFPSKDSFELGFCLRRHPYHSGFETHPVLVAFAAFAAIACFTWDSLPHIPCLNTSFSTLKWTFTNQNCNDMGVKPKAYHQNCHGVVKIHHFRPWNQRAHFLWDIDAHLF